MKAWPEIDALLREFETESSLLRHRARGCYELKFHKPTSDEGQQDIAARAAIRPDLVQGKAIKVDQATGLWKSIRDVQPIEDDTERAKAVTEFRTHMHALAQRMLAITDAIGLKPDVA